MALKKCEEVFESLMFTNEQVRNIEFPLMTMQVQSKNLVPLLGTIALGLLKNNNAKWRFFTSRGAHVNCAIYYGAVIHSIGNPP